MVATGVVITAVRIGRRGTYARGRRVVLSGPRRKRQTVADFPDGWLQMSDEEAQVQQHIHDVIGQLPPPQTWVVRSFGDTERAEKKEDGK